MNKKLLVLALVLAVGLQFIIKWYVNTVVKMKTETEMVRIVTTIRDISPNEKITEIDLNSTLYPKKLTNNNIIIKKEELIGKTVVYPIKKGLPITFDQVAGEKELGKGFSYGITNGKRALGLTVNSTDIFGDYLRAGDKIDVVGLYDIEMVKWDEVENKKVKTKKTQAKVLAENVKVLAVNKRYLYQQGELNKGEKEENSQNNKQLLVIEVTPEESQKIMLAQKMGIIYLSLRSPLDNNPVKIKTQVLD